LSERICRDQLTSASSLAGREGTPESGKTDEEAADTRACRHDLAAMINFPDRNVVACKNQMD